MSDESQAFPGAGGQGARLRSRRRLGPGQSPGEGDPADRVPDPPERRHHRHAAKPAEEAEDQDQAEAGILDPGLDHHRPAIIGREAHRAGGGIARPERQRVVQKHKPGHRAGELQKQGPVLL